MQICDDDLSCGIFQFEKPETEVSAEEAKLEVIIKRSGSM